MQIQSLAWELRSHLPQGNETYLLQLLIEDPEEPKRKEKNSFNDVDWAPSIDRKEVNQEASVKNQRYLKLMTTMTYEGFK